MENRLDCRYQISRPSSGNMKRAISKEAVPSLVVQVIIHSMPESTIAYANR